MKLEVAFNESKHHFPVSFGEIQTAGDGGYDRGYAEGEAAGYNSGYEIGAKEGAEAGYAKGEQDGYNKGHADGLADGIEQGKVEAIENLPGGYLKVDPTWTDFSNLCQARPSMVEHLKYSDTANGTRFLATFQSCDVETIPSLDLRKAQTIQNMFIYSGKIVEIGEMNIPKVTNAGNAFLSCAKLQRISFAPNCINVSISFANSSLLDDASIQSIIDGLADLTGKTAQKIQWHTDVVLKLTEEQILTIGNKNWTM